MKNLFKSLMLVAVAAMAFTACQNDVDDVNAVSKGTTITFNASFADETRVSLTDGDQDGVYQAAFEAGDHIMFAAYDQNDNLLDYTDEIILTEEQAANKDLTLTANFESEIGVGSKIKAFVNYYYDSYWERWVTYVNYNYQDAMVDSVENLNASAELVWNGEEFANIIFKHDNSFGKMTLVADGDVKFKSAQITVFDGEGSSKYANVVDEAQKVNNVFFFALNGEALNVSSMEVYAYDVDGNEYTFSKEFEPNQFHFKKGRVSKFTINKWYVALDMPEVKATPSEDGSEVVFSWEPVDNAAGYEVSVGYNEPTFTQETSCKVSFAGYNPFETIYVYVQAKAGKDTMFMDSQMANASYTVPINKNADGDTGFDFEYNKVEKLGDNWYKFSSTEHSYYMVLSFDVDDDIESITAGQSKVYTTSDGLNGWNDTGSYESFFTCQYNQQGYEGWFFQGDNMVFVDRLDNNDFEITAFCKREIVTDYSSWTRIYPLFKGAWKGKLGGSVEPEPEPEPEEDPETIELIYASATPAPAHRIGGTGYNVTFLDSEGNEYFWQVQTLGNNYLEVGEWNGDIAWGDVGHVAAVEWPGVSSPWPYIMNVAVDGKLYDINLQVTDYVYWGGTGLTHTARFKGNIVGMTVPGVEPEPVSSASAVLVTDTTFNGFNPYDVTFSFANGDKVVARFNTSGNQYLHLGEWQANDWQKPHYISLVKLNGENASVSACNVAYEDNAYTVTLTVYDYTAQSAKDYIYTGAIGGLKAPEACDCFKELEVPNTENLTLSLKKYSPYSVYCDIVFCDSEGKNSITLSLNDCPLVNNTYTVATSSANATASGTMYLDGCYVEYLGYQTGTSAYLKSGSVDVEVNDGVYTITLDLVLTNEQVYSGVFEGEIK